MNELNSKKIDEIEEGLKNATTEERYRLALEAIILITDGYTEWTDAEAWASNQIAKGALRIGKTE